MKTTEYPNYKFIEHNLEDKLFENDGKYSNREDLYIYEKGRLLSVLLLAKNRNGEKVIINSNYRMLV